MAEVNSNRQTETSTDINIQFGRENKQTAKLNMQSGKVIIGDKTFVVKYGGKPIESPEKMKAVMEIASIALEKIGENLDGRTLQKMSIDPNTIKYETKKQDEENSSSHDPINTSPRIKDIFSKFLLLNKGKENKTEKSEDEKIHSDFDTGVISLQRINSKLETKPILKPSNENINKEVKEENVSESESFDFDSTFEEEIKPTPENVNQEKRNINNKKEINISETESFDFDLDLSFEEENSKTENESQKNEENNLSNSLINENESNSKVSTPITNSSPKEDIKDENNNEVKNTEKNSIGEKSESDKGQAIKKENRVWKKLTPQTNLEQKKMIGKKQIDKTFGKLDFEELNKNLDKLAGNTQTVSNKVKTETQQEKQNIEEDNSEFETSEMKADSEHLIYNEQVNQQKENPPLSSKENESLNKEIKTKSSQVKETKTTEASSNKLKPSPGKISKKKISKKEIKNLLKALAEGDLAVAEKEKDSFYNDLEKLKKISKNDKEGEKICRELLNNLSQFLLNKEDAKQLADTFKDVARMFENLNNDYAVVENRLYPIPNK